MASPIFQIQYPGISSSSKRVIDQFSLRHQIYAPTTTTILRAQPHRSQNLTTTSLTLNLYQMGWASLSSLHSGSSRARFIQATTAGLLNRQPDLHQAIFHEPITTKSSDLLLIPQISYDNANKRPKSFVWNQ